MSGDNVLLRYAPLVTAFGDTSKGAGEDVSELRRFLRDPNLTSLRLFGSDWTFGLAAMAFGAVWTLVTGGMAKLERNQS